MDVFLVFMFVCLMIPVLLLLDMLKNVSNIIVSNIKYYLSMPRIITYLLDRASTIILLAIVIVLMVFGTRSQSTNKGTTDDPRLIKVKIIAVAKVEGNSQGNPLIQLADGRRCWFFNGTNINYLGAVGDNIVVPKEIVDTNLKLTYGTKFGL